MADVAQNPSPSLSPAACREMLAGSAAYRALPPDQQQEMAGALAKVFGYLGDNPATARPFAPDLGQLRGGQTAPPTPAPGSQPAGSGAPAPGQSGGGSAFTTASGATREMLGAIGFPEFTASLIQGTFQAIVDSSIQQMEAYANLLAETAKTVDVFMEDNITDDMAKDHLTGNYGDIFQKDLSAGYPELTVATDDVGAGQLPSFLKDLGFDSPLDIDQQALDEVVVPETRRTLAEMRHQSLATMVMMGINRIVVSDGEINAKLIFHVDAAESMSLSFMDYKPTNWNLAGTLGGSGFGASGIVVNTTNINAQSGVNMNAELTGEVRVRFRSDYFPLERFADSAAIQLINTHAKVPNPQPTAGTPAGNGNGAAPIEDADRAAGVAPTYPNPMRGKP
ncbi:MAG: hypothetical protein ACR2RE_27785 [Geminicoccaceae bacterium]